MSATNPTIREVLNKGILQQLADAGRAIGLGDLIAMLVQMMSGAGKSQSAGFTATGASEVLTFAQLGMVPPASLNYRVLAECETGGVTLDESTKTLLGFTLLGTTLGEVINVIVMEDSSALAEVLAVTLNVATMASPGPSMVLDVVATAGTTLGRKTLLLGGASVIPTAGQVVWDGGRSLRFAAADAVSAAKVAIIPAAGLATSMLDRQLGQTS